MNNNQRIILIIVAAVVGGLLLLNVGGKILIDKTADRVIEKIYKEYSPSPYGPGVDPDKVDINAFHRMQQGSPQPQKTTMGTQIGDPYSTWERQWEANRR